MANAKDKALYTCQSCGAETAKWVGQCGNCKEWNTLVEVPRLTAGKGARVGYHVDGTSSRVYAAKEVAIEDRSHFPTGVGELDRVLGGGLVTGSVVLIGGDPGIGKSTLLLQALAALTHKRSASSLYVTV